MLMYNEYINVLNPWKKSSCEVTFRPVNNSVVYDYGDYLLMRTKNATWYRSEGGRNYKRIDLKDDDLIFDSDYGYDCLIPLALPKCEGLKLCYYSTQVYKQYDMCTDTEYMGERYDSCCSAIYQAESGSALAVRYSVAGFEVTIRLRNGQVESVANKAFYTLYGNHVPKEEPTFGVTADDVWRLTVTGLSNEELEEIICRYRETGRWNR